MACKVFWQAAAGKTLKCCQFQRFRQGVAQGTAAFREECQFALTLPWPWRKVMETLRWIISARLWIKPRQ
jgi:hypothetical protein